MKQLEYAIEVPFTPNRGRRCAPACTKMILDTLTPSRKTTELEAEELSGFQEGRSTWAAQHLLSLHELGMDVGWIQDEDLWAFVKNPAAFILGQFGGNHEKFNEFIKTNDIYGESERIRAYLEQDLPFEQRDATREDIVRLAMGGWAVRLELNGRVLANQPGEVGHAVLVSGFNNTHVRLENPDGAHGSKPKQLVPWSRLDEAWTGYRALQYYKVTTDAQPEQTA